MLGTFTTHAYYLLYAERYSSCSEITLLHLIRWNWLQYLSMSCLGFKGARVFSVAVRIAADLHGHGCSGCGVCSHTIRVYHRVHVSTLGHTVKNISFMNSWILVVHTWLISFTIVQLQNVISECGSEDRCQSEKFWSGQSVNRLAKNGGGRVKITRSFMFSGRANRFGISPHSSVDVIRMCQCTLNYI